MCLHFKIGVIVPILHTTGRVKRLDESLMFVNNHGLLILSGTFNSKMSYTCLVATLLCNYHCCGNNCDLIVGLTYVVYSYGITPQSPPVWMYGNTPVCPALNPIGGSRHTIFGLQSEPAIHQRPSHPSGAPPFNMAEYVSDMLQSTRFFR